MYLAIVKQTGGVVEKYKDFPTQAEANSHVATHSGFVVNEPVGEYNLEYCTVDPVAKTITFDSSTFDSDRDMNTWKAKIAETDSGMPRFLEDLITSNSSLVIPTEMKVRYDKKIVIRGEKP